MKATFFRITRTSDAFPRINTVEFRVIFEENEEHPKEAYYIFELDENYQPTSVQQYQGSREKIRPWQIALLNTVENDLRELDRLNSDLETKEFIIVEHDRKTYCLESLPENEIRWTLETNTEDEATLEDCFTSAWNSFTEAASEAFDSITKAASSFFSTPEPVPYSFGKDEQDRVSTFKPDQIIKIEELINLLNREIKSVWLNNKELKQYKMDGLIAMLEESRKLDSDPSKIISKFKEDTKMVKGMFSRVDTLLNELSAPAGNILRKI